MSILDSITVAEQKAAQIKQEAAAEARETIRSAETQAGEEAAELIRSAEQLAGSSLKKAEEAALTEAQRLLQQQAAKDEAAAKAARAKLPQAARYIVERIEKQ